MMGDRNNIPTSPRSNRSSSRLTLKISLRISIFSSMLSSGRSCLLESCATSCSFSEVMLNLPSLRRMWIKRRSRSVTMWNENLDAAGINTGQLTVFLQVIRLLVLNSSGPPLRFGLFWVAFLARWCACSRSATVVRVLHLLARFNEFDECLCNETTVYLLEVLKGRFVVL